MFNVVEVFDSINGEGIRAGQLAAFIRFRGCNLDCTYCDTSWANQPDSPCRQMTVDQIDHYIQATGMRNVTLTGGEPLIQKNIIDLLKWISRHKELYVEIETNGSIPLEPFLLKEHRPNITMDYKLPSSGMEAAMCMENFHLLEKCDTVKFVSGSITDLDRARELINKFHLKEKCHVYLSPIYGSIEPEVIVNYMKEHKMNGVTLQMQLHKIIWSPDTKGV